MSDLTPEAIVQALASCRVNNATPAALSSVRDMARDWVATREQGEGLSINDLDAQERAGVIGVWLSPSSEGQTPLISLEMLGGRKRYLRVWLDGRDRVEWGWALPIGSVLMWKAADT